VAAITAWRWLPGWSGLAPAAGITAGPQIHPLSLERADADPELLRDLLARGARFARDLCVDIVVGAETAGLPLAASNALAGGLTFALVRELGYRGHEVDEPPVRGADVAGRRVLLVHDAITFKFSTTWIPTGSSIPASTPSASSAAEPLGRRRPALGAAASGGVTEP
jgi:hypothetical protein